MLAYLLVKYFILYYNFFLSDILIHQKSFKYKKFIIKKREKEKEH